MKLSSGSGVLLCNDWMMARNNPLFTTLPLHIYRNISLAWLTENHSDLVQLLIRELQRCFQSPES
jgi:hypothetical protein